MHPTPASSLPPLSYYARVTVVVLSVIALAWLAVEARGVLLLVLIAFLIAVGLDPLVVWLTTRGMRRGLAVTAVVLGVFVLSVLTAVLALAPAVSQFAGFVGSLPDQVQALSHKLGDTSHFPGNLLARPEVRDQVQKVAGQIPSLLSTSLGTVFGVVGAIVGAVVGALTISVLSIYFLAALPRIRTSAAALLGEGQRAEVMREALERVGGYVTGQTVVCLVHGAFCYVAFLLAGLPYPAVLALVVAVLDAVPQIGGLLGAVLVLGVALPTGIAATIGVGIFLIVFQQLENFLVVPRVFARAVELSPLAVLVAVIVGAGLAGLVGAFLALPVTAALKVVVRYALRNRLADVPDSPAETTPASAT